MVLYSIQTFFSWIGSSVANVAALDPNGIKILLANGLSTFRIKDNPVCSNGPKCLPKNTPNCPILWYWVFENFILSEEFFVNDFQSLETCVFVNNNYVEY